MASILLIDDCDELRDVLKQALEAESHEVYAAADGRTALDRLRREPFDVVVTDIYMPDMDGLEVLAAVQRLRDRPPVLAISGNLARADTLMLARHLGAQATLQKPFRPRDLVRAVDQLLSQSAPVSSASPSLNPQQVCS